MITKAKEKANELVFEKFKYELLPQAKQYALIIVDEILLVLGSDRIIYGSEYRYEENNYWNEVKEEINKL